MEPVDNVCKGLDFCVAVKADSANIEMKKMIKRHGGRIVEYPSEYHTIY